MWLLRCFLILSVRRAPRSTRTDSRVPYTTRFRSRSEGPVTTPSFSRKYIFPGGYIPALSEVMPTIERSGLWTTDIEILRLHYAETLKHWRMRFLAQWDKARTPYDERF